jgi:fatty-acyl-CoA synthase
LHRAVAAGHAHHKWKVIPVSSQGSNHPEARISADVMGARSQALGDLLRRTAARKPDKLALVNGELRWSYRELDQAVNRAAASLSGRGLSQGDRLALVSHNCWHYVVLAFATARIGAILVPVNFMLIADEMAYVLAHSGASGVVTEDTLHPTVSRAAALAGLTGGIRGWIPLTGAPAVEGWEDVTPWATQGDDAPPEVLVADDDPLRLMYTSGTESRPKGAILSSRSLIAQYVSCVVDGGMEPDDVELHSLPLYHCAQMDCFLGPDIYLGATSVILAVPDPATVLRTIATEKITKFFAPPTVWIALLRHPDFDGTDLTSLRKGYYGASAMPVEVLREIQQRLPDLRLWNFYGQTEMAPLATILPPEDQIRHAGSAGRPALNVETRVVDDEDQPVPAGEVGEIVHRSPQATLGYWNDPDKTAEAFRGGWFHSGDLGVMSQDGLLSVVDRKKDMIKTGGENVASREVEEAIYLHPDVAEVAVFATPDPRWVEAVTAAVVAKPGSTLTPDAVIEHCRGRLAGFKVPKVVRIVDSLPKNPSGKLLKRALRTDFQTMTAPADAPGTDRTRHEQ